MSTVTPPRGSIWRRALSWPRRHPLWSSLLTLLFAVVFLNVLAYQHARAMVTFQESGQRPRPPLSFWQKARLLAFGMRLPRPKHDLSPDDLGLPSETYRFPSADGTMLEAWLVPHPSPQGVVVLFHGYAGSRSSLLDVGRALHRLGYTTLLVDFRGSGGSDGNTTSIGYYEAADVVAAVEHVRSLNVPGPLILYGQSMGAAAVLRAIAVHGVRPDAVILESVFDRLLTTVRNRFTQLGVPSWPGAELLLFWGGVQMGFSGFEHNPAEYARQCTCPVLMMVGEEDPSAKPEEARAVCANLAGSHRFETFPGVKHALLYSADPKRWDATVVPFLNDIKK